MEEPSKTLEQARENSVPVEIPTEVLEFWNPKLSYDLTKIDYTCESTIEEICDSDKINYD